MAAVPTKEPGWMDEMSVGMTSATPVSSGSVRVMSLPLRSLMTRFGASKLSTVPRKRTGGLPCAAAVPQASASNRIRKRFIDQSPAGGTGERIALSGFHFRGEMRRDGLQQFGKNLRASSDDMAALHELVVACEIGDQSPCFGNHEDTGRHVPRRQSDLPESVEASGRDG